MQLMSKKCSFRIYSILQKNLNITANIQEYIIFSILSLVNVHKNIIGQLFTLKLAFIQ